ncbi:hypothetical protein EDC04DRAFT_2903512 [Pisolithus marmoratus]|nr:hypothetical protein EDC04DRAFT_2903512 [Pisolithus marmoratus]
MFWVDPRVPHNMPQPIHVRLQTPVGDACMQPGPQYPPHHEVTKDGSVSKKRRASGSRKGVARANVAHADSETSERTSIMGALPGQPCHPFPDWPSLDPSSPSVVAGPAGNGTVPSSATSLSGGPPDFSFAPFLKFFTESMNHLVLTFESNQLSVQHTMKEQQQQFSSHLELLHAKLAQTSPAAPPSPFGFHGDVEGGDDLPIPLKKKWTRCRFLKNARAVDGEVDMATYDQFLQYIHNHLLAFLGIKDLKNIADAKDAV